MKGTMARDSIEFNRTHDSYCHVVFAETTGFVDKLFECLTTKNYLGNPPAKESPKEEVKPTAVKSDVVEVRTKLVRNGCI